MSDYTKNGGEWLGAARSWIQRKCHNGCNVSWGSGDVLEPHLNVRQVEELAAEVADAANHEADKTKAKLEDIRKRQLESEIRMSFRIKRLEKLLREWLDTDGLTNTRNLREQTELAIGRKDAQEDR